MFVNSLSMIPREDVEKVLDTARIDEVVGDFVALKKRGANMLGLCPFHNERTPSFTVSPAKGIFKCFGCGKGGHSVDFIMQHEQLTFPEAIRYLAVKYNIELNEIVPSEEQKIEQSERESLFVVLQYAQKFFTNQLNETDEGRSVGLSYFKERGFTKAIIDKFQLGYSPADSKALTEDAVTNSYSLDNLVKTGLSIKPDDGRAPFDRFYGRVMFPIHNISGRVLGFGGRTLRSDKKIAKYINSPESEVYHKSNVLYGLYFSKKSIVELDTCFLVEGYTDVISLHQAGIENVVASSGTSLTVEQIRLIRRYTPNITILYDGDNAGIKASFRGIDLVLQEGMNVKVLLFPDGEDPDSYSKKVSGTELKNFITANSVDFVSFKTRMLYSEVASDPIKKAGTIKEIIETISLIPDAISQSVFVKETSRILEVDEQVLINELNKIRRKKHDKDNTPVPRASEAITEKLPEEKPDTGITTEPIEKEVIRLLIEYGQYLIKVENEQKETIELTVGEIIHHLITVDQVSFSNEGYQHVFHYFSDQYVNSYIPVMNDYLHNADPLVSKTAVDVVSHEHNLSPNWERHNIDIIREEDHLKPAVLHSILSLKTIRIQKQIEEIQLKLKAENSTEELMTLLEQQRELIGLKQKLAGELGRIVIK